MPTYVKALIIVLFIAMVVFRLAKPIALRFSTPADFARRRNIWFVLTAAAFLMPSFWLFALIAAPLLLWGGRRDANPAAFYVFLVFVIPEIDIEIPTIGGVNEFFALNMARLLSFFVLIPAAWRTWRAKDRRRSGGLDLVDLAIFGFALIQLISYVPPDLPNGVLLKDSPTNDLRRALLEFVDVYGLFYVLSRSCNTRKLISEVQAALCLAGAAFAMIAVFESVRHWLLYVEIGPAWGQPLQLDTYLYRGNSLRAQVTAGHSISLGFVLAVALGFWLYLSSRLKPALKRVIPLLMFASGILVTYARGPWVGAASIYFSNFMVGPRAGSRFVKAAAFTAIVAGMLAVSPLGDRIVKILPFFGTQGTASVEYRERLAHRAWQLIQQHPLLGDPLSLSKMQDLRQGEGIIDLVNTYAQTALFYGGIGLALFLAPLLIGLFRNYRIMRRTAVSDPEFSLLGSNLIACTVGVLLMMATCSFVTAPAQIFYVIAGLSLAYARLGRSPASLAQEATRPAAEQRVAYVRQV